MTKNPPLAPELPDTLEWINTEKPVKLADCRGKIILLDFWTAGSINCMHMLADLRFLRNKYRDNLVVIGIHSPKFPHEMNARSVKNSVSRLHIKHPVAHDKNKRVCKKYGIKAWPSIVLIDALGQVIGKLSGEGRRRQLDELIQKYIIIAEQKRVLNAVPFSCKISQVATSVLNYPGKILATPSHVYISDSGHNRILEINHHGRITKIFGSGGAGLLDGMGNEAAFNNPQGLVLANGSLYVADSGNHAIRRINLHSREILTVAGDGYQGSLTKQMATDPAGISLCSPWDISYQNGILYIAMAGTHQLWMLDLTDNRLSKFSGSGSLDLTDGKAEEAAFAQPFGLAIDEYKIYTCDAESSAIRLVRLPGGQVSTLVGRDLVTSGDCDGGWKQALLQHPQSIALDRAKQLLYVADTYNNKIKMINLKLNSIFSLDIDGNLDEPGGICLYDNILWVANTNAHEILKINLLNHKVEVLELNEPEQDF
jgi:thiol-disulfide isomerase/thioredoxin